MGSGILTIRIDTRSHVFERSYEGPGPEVARILHDLADKCEDGGELPHRILDCTGKPCGTITDEGHDGPLPIPLPSHEGNGWDEIETAWANAGIE